jgi:hypothetical protein
MKKYLQGLALCGLIALNVAATYKPFSERIGQWVTDNILNPWITELSFDSDYRVIRADRIARRETTAREVKQQQDLISIRKEDLIALEEIRNMNRSALIRLQSSLQR